MEGFRVLGSDRGQRKTAEEFFLTGWVKNCEDSTVECEVCGEKEY